MNTLISFLEKLIPFSDQKLIAFFKFVNKFLLILAFLGTIGTIGFAIVETVDSVSWRKSEIPRLEEDIARYNEERAEWEKNNPGSEYYRDNWREEELQYYQNYTYLEAMLDFGLWLILGSIVGLVLYVLYYRIMKILLNSIG